MSKTKHISEVIREIFPPLTAGEITKAALEYFELNGYKCWRNNQIPQRGRPFRGLNGVPDIIGHSTVLHPEPGLFFACEVKTKRDSLSDEQKDFLRELNASGGIGYLAEDDGRGGVKYRLYTDKK